MGVVGYIHCVPSRDVAIITRSDCGKRGLFRRWGHDGLARGAPSSITGVLVTRESGERRPYQGTWCDAGRRHHPMCTCMTHTCSFTTLLTVRLPHPPCAPGGQQPTWWPPPSGAAAARVDSSPWLVSPDSLLHCIPHPFPLVLPSFLLLGKTTPGTLIPSILCTRQPSYPCASSSVHPSTFHPAYICPSVHPSLHPPSHACTPLSYLNTCCTKDN